MAAISVVVPVYNVEQYLAECLDSILAQTMKDFEVICVNDGSKDGSEKILNEYAARDKRIVIVKQENQGLSAARNAGVKRATGEYIYYVDSDDAIAPNTLEVLMQNIKATHADIIVFGMKDMIASPKDPWFDKVSTPRSAWYSPFVPYALFYEQGGYPFVWRNIYRRKMLTDNNLTFPQDLRYGEDVVYQFLVFPYARRIQYIPDKLYLYRRLRKDSLTSLANDSISGLVKKHIEMVGYIHDEWDKRSLIEQHGMDLYCWMLNFVVPDFKRMPKDDQKPLAEALLASMKYSDSYTPYMNDFDKKLFSTLKVAANSESTQSSK